MRAGNGIQKELFTYKYIIPNVLIALQVRIRKGRFVKRVS